MEEDPAYAERIRAQKQARDEIRTISGKNAERLARQNRRRAEERDTAMYGAIDEKRFMELCMAMQKKEDAAKTGR